jgi:anthranilate phosphoribosyltransferase
MDVQPCLETIVRGRGPDRDLPYALARRVFDAALGGEIADLELGAMLVAMRMKGPSADELRAGLDALAPLLRVVPVDPARPVVAIPSYGGALDTANLVPLLACLVAGAGVQVVIHGVTSDPDCTTTAQVMRAMGLAPVGDLGQAQATIARGDPAFVPVGTLCPPLEGLLSLRTRLGVRHVGHLLATLLDPTDAARCLRLACPPGRREPSLPRGLLERTGRSWLVQDGVDGEAVASAVSGSRIDWVHDGRTEVLVPRGERVPRDPPVLPEPRDASATARWIQSVLAGERPVPGTIALQASAVLHAVGLAPMRRAAVAA